MYILQRPGSGGHARDVSRRQSNVYLMLTRWNRQSFGGGRAVAQIRHLVALHVKWSSLTGAQNVAKAKNKCRHRSRSRQDGLEPMLRCNQATETAEQRSSEHCSGGVICSGFWLQSAHW